MSQHSDADELEQAIIERIRQLGVAADPAFLVELIDSYTPLFEKHQASLVSSLEKRDRNKIHYAAHAIKGASLNIGAGNLADAARALEQQSETGSFETIATLLQELEHQMDRARGALRDVKTKLTTQ